MMIDCPQHNGNFIVSFCAKVDCQSKKPSCFQCNQSVHKDHYNYLRNINDLQNFYKQQQENIKKGHEYYQIIKNSLENFKQYIDQLKIHQTQTIEQLNDKELDNLIRILIKLELTGASIFPQVQHLSTLATKINIEIQKSKKIQNTVTAQPLQFGFQIGELSKMTLRFSEEKKYKSETITICNNRTTVQTNQGQIGFVLLEPNIKNDSQIFQIQIQSLEWIALGLCHKQFIDLEKGSPQLNSNNHGTYLIDNNGYIYSHIKNQSSSFRIQKNEVISIKLDFKEKILRFENQCNHIIKLTIDTTQNLNFLIGLKSSSVQISQ